LLYYPVVSNGLNKIAAAKECRLAYWQLGSTVLADERMAGSKKIAL